MPSIRPPAWARQGFRYVAVGLFQLVLDWGGFVALTAAGVDTAIANPTSRTCVMLLGFWLHGTYTFADGNGHRLSWGRLARFLTTWVTLTVLGTVLLKQLADAHGLGAAWLAKPMVEACLAVMSFLSLRFWVFRKQAAGGRSARGSCPPRGPAGDRTRG